MKKVLPVFLFIMLLLCADCIAQNRSIVFSEKPLTEILSSAKKEKKLVFMDAYASWCGPCKWMAANIFTNDSAADYYNKTFICTKVDMEKGEGIILQQKYQVRAYPTLLFLDTDGNIVHMKVGAVQSAANLISLAHTALDPDECYAGYKKRYSQGENSPEFIYKYLQRISDAYLPVEGPLERYLSAQKETDYSKPGNWKIIYAYCNDMDSKVFTYMVAHQAEFIHAHGRDSVDKKISDVFMKAIVDLSRSEIMSDTSYSRLKRKILASGFAGADKVIFDADLNNCQIQGDAAGFLALAYKGLDMFYSNDPEMLNNVAWIVHQISKDKKYLGKALLWSKRSVELKSDASTNDTYAALLYDLGNKEEAVKYCKIALGKARAAGIPSETIEENLKKYETGQ